MRKKTFLLGIIITIFFTLTFFLYRNLQNINIFEVFEFKTLDSRYKVRGEIKKDFDVVIIGIDEKSLNLIGKWPWKRDIHGDLVRKLNEYGVKSIGFDVSFTEAAASKELLKYKSDLKAKIGGYYKDKSIEKEVAIDLLKEIKKLDLSEDLSFAKALKETGNVSIGTYLNVDKGNLTDEILENRTYLKSRYENIDGILDELKERQRTGERRFKTENPYKVIPPVEIIGQFAYGVAPFDVGKPNADGLFRTIPLAVLEEYTGLYFPPLYLLVYLNAYDYTLKDNVVLNVRDGTVEFYKNASKKEGYIFTIPANKDGYQRLNFYGGNNTFKSVSYIDVINGDANKEDLKGKIVLVGYTDTAKGLYDLRATPFSPNSAGVEIHATAIQNLIDRSFMIRWEIGPHILILFIYGLLLTLPLVIKKLKFVEANLVAITIIFSYVLFSQMLFSKGIWVDMFYPLVSYFFLYLTLTIVNYFDEEKEKRKVKNAFKHYTSPALIDELMKNPDKLKLGGEKKNLTMFFSDIEGFTTISESMGPEELVEFLNEYLSIMTKIIFKYNGMVDKYEGDAIMAVFGAPVELKEHALMSCYAALEYQEELTKLRAKWIEQGLPDIKARIGINTGEVVVGNMGSQDRFDYTVIGDQVNLASRLEGANKQYGTYIMISQATYEYVKDDIEVRELDNIKVKGKNKPVGVYELLARKGNLSYNKKEVLDSYELGLKNYKSMNWEEAIKEFENALEKDKTDTPSKVYLERCIYFRDNPPSEDWDGIYTMKTK